MLIHKKKELQLVPDAIKEALEFLEIESFEKVSRLGGGFESSQDSELAATVHWFRKHEQANSTGQVI
ncbi:hypothetical protein [Vibrio sp. YIC-376]|uniref:hypothetical protein n=1 Tax=Vibrio sp. YIC-376 TaxID=3136162 RepID=UPI00402A7067